MNLKINKVLVPTDFSECSERALEYAVSFVRMVKSQILLLHVIEPQIYGIGFSYTHYGIPPGYRNKLMEMMQKKVIEIRDLEIDAEGYFLTGVPSVGIIGAAEAQKADLIIMGTHGRTGLSHVLLGSTAERVIQRAHCPVLTVQLPKIPLHRQKERKEELEGVVGDIPLETKGETFCRLCAQPASGVFCEGCKIRIQAEALEKKRRVEREGYTGTGRR